MHNFNRQKHNEVERLIVAQVLFKRYRENSEDKALTMCHKAGDRWHFSREESCETEEQTFCRDKAQSQPPSVTAVVLMTMTFSVTVLQSLQFSSTMCTEFLVLVSALF